jgi:hypothetical protein
MAGIPRRAIALPARMSGLTGRAAGRTESAAAEPARGLRRARGPAARRGPRGWSRGPAAQCVARLALHDRDGLRADAWEVSRPQALAQTVDPEHIDGARRHSGKVQLTRMSDRASARPTAQTPAPASAICRSRLVPTQPLGPRRDVNHKCGRGKRCSGSQRAPCPSYFMTCDMNALIFATCRRCVG